MNILFNQFLTYVQQEVTPKGKVVPAELGSLLLLLSDSFKKAENSIRPLRPHYEATTASLRYSHCVRPYLRHCWQLRLQPARLSHPDVPVSAAQRRELQLRLGDLQSHQGLYPWPGLQELLQAWEDSAPCLEPVVASHHYSSAGNYVENGTEPLFSQQRHLVGLTLRYQWLHAEVVFERCLGNAEGLLGFWKSIAV